MTRTTLCSLAVLSAALLAAGCQERPAPAAPPVAAPAPAAPATVAPITDGWVGQWNGPEGTYLKITGGQGRYEVTVRNLDGPRSFAGTAQGEGIAFERDGVVETVHATRGADTGMKWLAEKSDCLTVRSGEGYCRD